MESIWSKTANMQEHPCLDKDINVEVAIIGGGLSGILTAYFLKCRGVDSVVLEARRIGEGQTKNTTAKITSQHGLLYSKLIRSVGQTKAMQYMILNEISIEKYRKIIKKQNIDCDFELQPAYLYSELGSIALLEEEAAVKRLGMKASFTTDTSLPFSVKGALRFDGQAQFHPLKFIDGLAKGVRIYEKSRVSDIADTSSVPTILTVDTPDGSHIVTANKVVFATHFPYVNSPGYYFMRMHQERSYVIAVSGVFDDKGILPDGSTYKGMYYGIDESSLSFRRHKDILLVGGGNHRTGNNMEGGKYDNLRAIAQKYYPESKEIAYWSAQDCMTLDGIPYIGQFSPSTPNWYVATGYKKWGMTSSMAAAILISDLITGKRNEFASVFEPHRFNISASAAALLKEGYESMKGLYRQASSGFDENNPPRCTHLGCQLKWNPDEKSWDCSCHGSRFDEKGNILDNPAQTNLNLT